jgi:iron complex transport system substrate-binding protein
MMSARTLCGLLGLCGVVTACSPVQAPPPRHRQLTTLDAPPQENLNRSCPDRDVPEWDYFPDKVRFEHSTQLTVSYHRSYKVVDIVPSIRKNVPLRYILYQCGTARPEGYDAAVFLEVPLQRAVLNTPAMGSTVEALGVVDRIFGVNDLHQFTVPSIIKAGEEGRIVALGTRSPSSIELATTIDIDAVFLFYSANPVYNLHPALRRLGVGAVPLINGQESTPLGEAEWAKFFALFFNEERRANEMFDRSAAAYNALAARARQAPAKPVVLLGFSWTRDVWTASGGENHYARLVEDAGGEYFLADDSQSEVNIRMPFEKAVYRSARTPIWISHNGLARIPSKAALARQMPLFAQLFPMERGRVYALDSGAGDGEAVPLTDASLNRPEVLLADLVSVFHPEVLPNYRPVFIRELP